jgi:hypothetical protein
MEVATYVLFFVQNNILFVKGKLAFKNRICFVTVPFQDLTQSIAFSTSLQCLPVQRPPL